MTPSSMTWGTPPTAVATVGTPRAMASSTLMGRPSFLEGKQYTAARSKRASRSPPVTQP